MLSNLSTARSQKICTKCFLFFFENNNNLVIDAWKSIVFDFTIHCFPHYFLINNCYLFSRICINVYEFMKQENVLICTNHLNTTWNLPRWGRFMNQVCTYDTGSNFSHKIGQNANFDRKLNIFIIEIIL